MATEISSCEANISSIGGMVISLGRDMCMAEIVPCRDSGKSDVLARIFCSA